MEKNKKKLSKALILSAISLTILVVIFIIFNKYKANMQEPKYSKVLVIGMDGMDPKVTSQLIKGGKLPNFRRLSEMGSFVELKTTNPAQSPVAWTSIATGVNPGKHDMFDFITRDPDSYIPELALSKPKSGISGTKYISRVKAKTFWEFTSEKNIPTTVIRWPEAFPPSKVRGKFLSGLGVPDLKGFLSSYSFYTTKELTYQDMQSNKVIKVELEDSKIKTTVSGPKTRRSGKIVDVTVPLEININQGSANLKIGGSSYGVGLDEWSDWISVKFKVGPLRSVYGIFKAYLVSLDPFELFLTTVQIDPENPFTDISYPKDYSKELAEKIGLYYTLGIPEETDPVNDGKIDKEVFLELVNQIEEQRNKMFWTEFENFKNDNKGLYAFAFDSSDRLQHIFWDNKVLGQNSEKIKINKNVEDYWIAKDEFLGKVLEEIDDSVLLIIFSDHGFSSFEKAVNLNNWLVKEGYMALTQDMAQGEEGALFRYVDWEKTKAYAVGFNSIYINEKGREGNGIIEDKKPLIDEISAKIENLKDKDGRKVVNKAYKASNIYSGEFAENGPDIVVGYKPGYRASWQTAIGGFGDEIISNNDKAWSGDHLIDPIFVPGVLFSNKKIKSKSASALDIAPTILNVLGIEADKDFEGKVLIE